MKIQSLYNLAKRAPYNYEGKEAYRKAAMSFIRKLAKLLGLPKGSYSTRWNAGGIAVDGDAILHHDKFYVNLSPGCSHGGYWRLGDSQKDYFGKQNRFVRGDHTLESLAGEISSFVTK